LPNALFETDALAAADCKDSKSPAHWKEFGVGLACAAALGGNREDVRRREIMKGHRYFIPG
jgi:hypothetical protein